MLLRQLSQLCPSTLHTLLQISTQKALMNSLCKSWSTQYDLLSAYHFHTPVQPSISGCGHKKEHIHSAMDCNGNFPVFKELFTCPAWCNPCMVKMDTWAKQDVLSPCQAYGHSIMRELQMMGLCVVSRTWMYYIGFFWGGDWHVTGTRRWPLVLVMTSPHNLLLAEEAFLSDKIK